MGQSMIEGGLGLGLVHEKACYKVVGESGGHEVYWGGGGVAV